MQFIQTELQQQTQELILEDFQELEATTTFLLRSEQFEQAVVGTIEPQRQILEQDR